MPIQRNKLHPKFGDTVSKIKDINISPSPRFLFPKFPKFDPLCQFDFKGERCGYRGTEKYCNKTPKQCKSFSNFSNYGGFPTINPNPFEGTNANSDHRQEIIINPTGRKSMMEYLSDPLQAQQIADRINISTTTNRGILQNTVSSQASQASTPEKPEPKPIPEKEEEKYYKKYEKPKPKRKLDI